MPLVVGDSHLTLEDVERVARVGEKVELAPEALRRIRTCRNMLEEKVAAGEIMYGVNTGIGEFSEVVLTEEQVRDFQKYLIFNHSAGIGDPVAEENVRAAILSRIRERMAAVGAWMAGRRPVLLMQNSGLGVAVNALSSLMLMYRTPALLVIWHALAIGVHPLTLDFASHLLQAPEGSLSPSL